MKSNNDGDLLLALDGPWQLVYLPRYVQHLRNIEAMICKSLCGLQFEEVMLPRIISQAQFEELEKCMPRFMPEWSAESLTARIERHDISYTDKFHLCHWQCEPFYFYLKKVKPNCELRFFDRSGWSYRAERTLDANRLLAFQRIECVFFTAQESARSILEDILEGIEAILRSLGLVTRLAIQEKEMEMTNEVLVMDLEALDANGAWVEVVGSHLHGSLMTEGLAMELASSYVTGCCGIGLSRIANLVATV